MRAASPRLHSEHFAFQAPLPLTQKIAALLTADLVLRYNKRLLCKVRNGVNSLLKCNEIACLPRCSNSKEVVDR